MKKTWMLVLMSLLVAALALVVYGCGTGSGSTTGSVTVSGAS